MFALAELGFVWKVLLKYAPFPPPFPGVMQELSDELFSKQNFLLHKKST